MTWEMDDLDPFEREHVERVALDLHEFVIQYRIEKCREPDVLVVPPGLLPEKVDVLWGVPVAREDAVIRYGGAS